MTSGTSSICSSTDLEALLADRNLGLEVTPEARDLLAELGYDPVYGARPLKRVIQQRLQNPIALEVLEGHFPEGTRRPGGARRRRPRPCALRLAPDADGRCVGAPRRPATSAGWRPRCGWRGRPRCARKCRSGRRRPGWRGDRPGPQRDGAPAGPDRPRRAARHSAAVAAGPRTIGCGCDHLFVTLEPCAQCAGAIVLAKLGTVVFGAWDAAGGMAGSVYDLLRHPALNHRPEVVGGVMAEECGELLRRFFLVRR